MPNPSRPLPTHVEDVPDQLISADDALSDDDLARGGMTPVAGWMRTRSSANALRQRRAKERRAKGDDGRPARKQLNIQAPADPAAREALKAVSERLVDGDLSPSDLDVMGRLDTMRLGIAASRVMLAGGWRATILRRLLSGH